jgi:hypothetical protein
MGANLCRKPCLKELDQTTSRAGRLHRGADRLLAAITSFETALTWPETQQRIQALLKRGLQRDGDFEHRWPAALDTLLET